jgi:hypothetical protein
MRPPIFALILDLGMVIPIMTNVNAGIGEAMEFA